MIAAIYVVIVLLHVWHNYTIRKNRLSRKDYRDIKKLPEMAKYAAAVAVVSAVTVLWFGYSWYYNLLLAIFARCTFFDVPFNLATGKKYNYENIDGESWIDRLELKTGLKFEIRLIIYLLLFFFTAIFAG